MLEQKLNSEQKDETRLPSSPNSSNTNVMCSQNEGCIKRQIKNYIMLLEWLAFWGWVIAICLLFF